MEPISHVVKVSIPNYLSELPIPNSIGGWFRLGIRDWISLVPFGVAVGGISWMSYKAFCPKARRNVPVNFSVEKSQNKVVHSFDIEDLGDKAVYCRCWRSQKFPYCDGSHNAHNILTGDNVGPLIVAKKK